MEGIGNLEGNFARQRGVGQQGFAKPIMQ